MDKISVIKKHEYISVVFGRHRLTASYSGIKGSGATPTSLFDLFANAMDLKPDSLAKIGLSASANRGQVADAFAKAIPTLWADWNKAPFVPAVGSRVQCDFGKRKGMDSGTVIEIKRNYADVQWDKQGRISVQFDMLQPAA